MAYVLHQLLRESAERRPDAEAVRLLDQALSYVYRAQQENHRPDGTLRINDLEAAILLNLGHIHAKRGDLAQTALRRFLRQPGEKAGDGGAVAAMGGAGAVQFRLRRSGITLGRSLRAWARIRSFSSGGGASGGTS